MAHVAMLTYRMALGFGVDVVVAEISRRLVARGHRVSIVCIDSDKSYSEFALFEVPPKLASVRAALTALKPDRILAHTSPFFEMLPELADLAPVYALEMGDPTPELFGKAKGERQAIKDAKLKTVYPVVKKVFTISRFLRSDIGWPAAIPLVLGSEHLDDFDPKAASDCNVSRRKLKLGTLMRLGAGEAHYKGYGYFFELIKELKKRSIDVEPSFLGRGESAQAQEFERQGIQVTLNASFHERNRYLRSLDVFISPSLWEGFNLPLLEAQAFGTVGLAWDVGAHPEVTPFVLSSLTDAISAIEAYSKNADLLLEHSRVAYKFVRSRFRWDRAVDVLAEHLELETSGVKLRRSGSDRLLKLKLQAARLRWIVQTYGAKKTARKALRRLLGV